MPKTGKRLAKRLVIRFVKAMLIFASHRLRNPHLQHSHGGDGDDYDG
jgi:hypothetical protein